MNNVVMTPQAKFYEYYDALMSAELAMLMAIKWGEPLNLTVRLATANISMRCKDERNKQLFLGVSKTEFPPAMVYQMRTMFDKAMSE